MPQQFLKNSRDIAVMRYRLLTATEKTCVNSITMVGLALFIYLAAIQPSMNFSRAASNSKADERALQEFVQQHADQVRQLSAARQAKTGSDTSLLALISKTAGEHQLALQRYAPDGDEKLAVWLSDIEFNKLLPWLDQLTSQYNVRVERTSISQKETPGRVETQIIFSQ